MKLVGLILVALTIASCGGEANYENAELLPDPTTNQPEIPELQIETEGSDTNEGIEEEQTDLEINSCKTNFDVYISDPGEAFTNVRNAPSGDIIMELLHGEVEQEYMLTIIEVTNGWFKFKGPLLGVEEDLEVPGGFGWVHQSVVATDTRNYGNQSITLYESADESSKETGTIDIESGGLRILDACNDWVLIELSYDDYYRKGWMKAEWCCGNPFTNCS
ncbi:MAG: hypothetical protein GQ574_05100 [Crocinitomix sp.]|nr:hypothetical protein [Crocinitomix sp.]